MTSKTFYQLLEVAPGASDDEIKRAFRVQIARYHPDKVQHLGQEFQAMAAARAAELTEAYRILSDAQCRTAYDRSLVPDADASTRRTAPVSAPAQPRPASTPEDVPPPGASQAGGQRFSSERAMRDQVVRQATFNRFRQALSALGGAYDASEARGFDFAWLPKTRLFGRSAGPRLVGRLVSRVDSEAVAGAWADAGRWAPKDDV